MRTLMLALMCALALMPLPARAMTIGSSTFKPGGTMPTSTVYKSSVCTGQNRSPELHWKNAPKATRSFALIVHDPDAPVPGGFDHWFAYNIPADKHNLIEAVKLGADEQGENGFGKREYDGPCPPPGKPHHYIFTIYALNVAHIGAGGMGGRDLANAMRGHILASAHITGMYGR